MREQEKEVGVLLASRDRQTGRVLGREGCNDACLGYKKEKEKEKEKKEKREGCNALCVLCFIGYSVLKK